MNDLISRSALAEEIAGLRIIITGLRPGDGAFSEFVRQYRAILHIINEAPAVDAVPVVRCCDCKWYKKSKRYGYYRCGNPCEGMVSGVELMPYDYCSYGERRNGDG